MSGHLESFDECNPGPTAETVPAQIKFIEGRIRRCTTAPHKVRTYNYHHRPTRFFLPLSRSSFKCNRFLANAEKQAAAAKYISTQNICPNPYTAVEVRKNIAH